MGEVKEAVRGSGSPRRSTAVPGGGNLLEQLRELKDEVSRLVGIKDDDTLSEGDTEMPENARKAATLRAVHGLIRAAERLLEDY